MLRQRAGPAGKFATLYRYCSWAADAGMAAAVYGERQRQRLHTEGVKNLTRREGEGEEEGNAMRCGGGRIRRPSSSAPRVESDMRRMEVSTDFPATWLLLLPLSSGVLLLRARRLPSCCGRDRVARRRSQMFMYGDTGSAFDMAGSTVARLVPGACMRSYARACALARAAA